MSMFEELDLMLPEESLDGPMQMALDETLLRQVTKPLLRIYRWAAPCVSFGYFQKLDEVRSSYSSIPLVRRWTGGGMVEHGVDLTFSLMIPRGEKSTLLPPQDFYRELHGHLSRWLSELLSPDVRVAGDRDIRVGSSCFTAPARDDLLLGERKILGGAQRRSAGALLYQGSLQVVGVSHGAMVCPGEIHQELARTLAPVIVPTRLLRSSEEKAGALAESRYRLKAWNERW